jgi:hypothetical protein
MQKHAFLPTKIKLHSFIMSLSLKFSYVKKRSMGYAKKCWAKEAWKK